jgi:hypothetical protein
MGGSSSKRAEVIRTKCDKYIDEWYRQIRYHVSYKKTKLTPSVQAELRIICSNLLRMDLSEKLCASILDKKKNMQIKLGTNIRYLVDFEIQSFAVKVIKDIYPLLNGVIFSVYENKRTKYSAGKSWVDQIMKISWENVQINKNDIKDCMKHLDRNESMEWGQVRNLKDAIVYSCLHMHHMKWMKDDMNKAYKIVTGEETKPEFKEPIWDGKVATIREIIDRHERGQVDKKNLFVKFCIELDESGDLRKSNQSAKISLSSDSDDYSNSSENDSHKLVKLERQSLLHY